MKEALSKLDKMVEKGKIIEAFDTYFNDKVTTYDESGNKTTSKAEKRSLLEGFFKEFTRAESIKLHDSFIDGDTSYSKFSFNFKNTAGKVFKWEELIIRKWDKNLVVSEFYSNQDFDTVKKALKKKTEIKKESGKKKEVATTGKVEVEKVEVKAAVKEATAKARSTKAITPAAKNTPVKAATPKVTEVKTVTKKAPVVKAAAKTTTTFAKKVTKPVTPKAGK